jgi:hypothetical protein
LKLQLRHVLLKSGIFKVTVFLLIKNTFIIFIKTGQTLTYSILRTLQEKRQENDICPQNWIFSGHAVTGYDLQKSNMWLKESCLLGCCVVWPGRSLPAFRGAFCLHLQGDVQAVRGARNWFNIREPVEQGRTLGGPVGK